MFHHNIRRKHFVEYLMAERDAAYHTPSLFWLADGAVFTWDVYKRQAISRGVARGSQGGSRPGAAYPGGRQSEHTLGKNYFQYLKLQTTSFFDMTIPFIKEA